jgi:3'-phosphoadenosine 5'-phosphosulfate sulfotransferase (PAPS reductase)/FAD synthetase
MARRVSEERAREWVTALRDRREQKQREADPFRLPSDTPVAVSFSGGRTSGYLLWRLLERHGGQLPDNTTVVFRNTGKEREESLEFVEECSRRWQVVVVWLEYRYHKGKPRDQKHGFEQVDFKTASRHGEPFDQIIEARADVRREKDEELILPNQGMRWCTGELKQKTLLRYLRSLGVWGFTNIIGIRSDEPKRWMKIVDCKGGRMAGEVPSAPLFDAGIAEADVLSFWGSQPFDLRLRPHEGNCDLCFLKAKWKRQAIAAERPQSVHWWSDHEKRTGCLFRLNDPYEKLLQLGVPGKSCGDDEEEQECHCTD